VAEQSDEELEKLLAERDEAAAKQAEADAEALVPGPCPVCKQDLAEVPLPGPLQGLLAASPLPLIRRAALSCEECGLKTPHKASAVGWLLAMVLALGLGLSGMSSIFTAQRITDPGQQKTVFLAGALLFGAGLFVGYGVHGAASDKLVAQRILTRRHLREAKEKPEDEADPGWFQENLAPSPRRRASSPTASPRRSASTAPSATTTTTRS
jgi:hypothetical protein